MVCKIVWMMFQLRVVQKCAKIFTPLHKDLFGDLFRLSVSRYSEVRMDSPLWDFYAVSRWENQICLHIELFVKDLQEKFALRFQVRKTAQSRLAHGFHIYSYSYRALLDDILGCLVEDSSIEHHQFKV